MKITEVSVTVDLYVRGEHTTHWYDDSSTIWQNFLWIMSQLRITVCGTLKHDFPQGGFSGLILLAESHAAIHTAPEIGIAFAHMATCGDDQTDLFLNLIEQKIGKVRLNNEVL